MRELSTYAKGVMKDSGGGQAEERIDQWRREIQGTEQPGYWLDHLHIDIAKCYN